MTTSLFDRLIAQIEANWKRKLTPSERLKILVECHALAAERERRLRFRERLNRLKFRRKKHDNTRRTNEYGGRN